MLIEPPYKRSREANPPSEYVEYDEAIKRRVDPRESRCFLCVHGSTSEAKRNRQHIAALTKIIKETITSVPISRVAADLHEYFEAKIKPVQPDLEFSRKDAETHIMYHMKAPTVILMVRIERTRDIIRYIEDHIISDDGEGQVKIDHKLLKSLIDYSKELRDLVQQSPHNSFLFDEFVDRQVA